MASSRTGLTPHLRFRRAVLNRDRRNGITNCPHCNVAMDYQVSRQPNSAEPDHIVPIARGGTNDPSNGRAICRRCNQSRGANDTPKHERKHVQASDGW
mgnify:CR=1